MGCGGSVQTSYHVTPTRVRLDWVRLGCRLGWVVTTKHFKNGKISIALIKQSIIEELLKSGFSPTVKSKTLLYETLDKFLK